MSFLDYIQDLPMTISQKFYPPPNIVIGNIFVPKNLAFSDIKYNFDAEYRARKQFDDQNVFVEESISSEEEAKPSIYSDVPELSQEVLVPCPVTLSAASFKKEPTSSNLPGNQSNSFVDFEAQHSVFDEVELLALDEKKVLQEVLMSSSSSSSLDPLPTNTINNNMAKINIEGKEDEKIKELKRKLLSKGFRPDVVNICTTKLPKHRFSQIEYYMKACRTIEKTNKATIDEAIDFLVKSNLTDKKTVLSYSETCANLLNMGYSTQKTFNAIIQNNGDQSAAIRSLSNQ